VGWARGGYEAVAACGGRRAVCDMRRGGSASREEEAAVVRGESRAALFAKWADK
jgi:hypothetical protein